MSAEPQSSADAGRPDEAASSNADDGRWAQRGVVPSGGGGTGWVVVADEAIARLLTTTDVPGELVPLHALTDPAAHRKEGELHVNDGGRRSGRVGGDGGRMGAGGEAGSNSVTASAGESNQHLVARAFARRLAQHLTDAHRQKQFETLRIVAAPRFLGLLRQELSAQVKAAVVDELSKDLTHASDDDVARRLLGGG